MRVKMVAGLMALTAGAPAFADVATVPIAGTRLDVSAEGEVMRESDIAAITAGVVTNAGSAAAASSGNAQRMAAVLAALRSAGVADRDIRTTRLGLSPQYRYTDGQAPAITGYQASNQLTVTFRDIKRAGAILDSLVGHGANEISGPAFRLEHPDAALDEARVQAVAKARARADLYARAAGLTVKRIVAISEEGGYNPEPPRPMMMAARAAKVDSAIVPGEERIGVNVNVTFELQ